MVSVLGLTYTCNNNYAPKFRSTLLCCDVTFCVHGTCTIHLNFRSTYMAVHVKQQVLLNLGAHALCIIITSSINLRTSTCTYLGNCAVAALTTKRDVVVIKKDLMQVRVDLMEKLTCSVHLD